MFTNTKGWLWQFESDYTTHGLSFAARAAARKGVPMSMTLEATRILKGAK